MAEINPQYVNYSELMNQLRNALSTYGTGNSYGPSYLDQYRNAQSGQTLLNDLKNSGKINNADYKNLSGSMGSMKGNAIIGGGLSALSSASSILGTATGAARINDTSEYENRIADMNNIGRIDYGNYDQLAQDMSSANFGLNTNYDAIRGMGGSGITMEKAGAVGSSALSGAMTGLQIGGPWGALAGGVIGGGAALAGIVQGDTNARAQERILNAEAARAADSAQLNFSAAHERIADRNDRNNLANSVAEGGKIHIDPSKKGTFTAAAKKRNMTVQEFASKVLSHKDSYSPAMVKKANFARNAAHWHGEGGTIVRIKRK